MNRKRSHPAVRFLWVVAGLAVLVIIGAFAYRIFEQDLMRWTLVPKKDFEVVAAPDQWGYDRADAWIARPDLRGNAAAWTPPGFASSPQAKVSVFFVHPTSFLASTSWNAPLDDEESQRRAALFVRSQASVFNGIGEIWAPKYRQATFGAFLTSEDNAKRALDFAYRDVLAAYEAFLEQAPADRPIVLAGHSQGSLHLLRLLQERVRGAPEAQRIAAAYLVGWPISVTADVPVIPLPPCETALSSGCLVSWQSFAEPADPKLVTDVYDLSRGPTGLSRAGSPMLCVNPINGIRGGEASASANLGTLVPNADFTEAEFQRGAVPARCDLRGFLLIGENPPEMGPYVLPGENYHVYDYALFWGSIRADAERRIGNFLGEPRED